VSSGKRAGEIIGGIRALVKKVPPRKDRLDINEAILEVISLTRSEMTRNGVSLRTDLTGGLPSVEGDRIQLQQVVLNLIINAIEAMGTERDGARELLIASGADGADGVSVAVRDSGPGPDPQDLERLFEAFYTTKPSGMGMGLAICRSIIDAHGGRISAGANEPRGAVFRFTLPARPDAVS
jgi:signal transduction histidine kinase